MVGSDSGTREEAKEKAAALERSAKNAIDLATAANAWHDVGDDHRAREVMDRAEGVAANSVDWMVIQAQWVVIGDKQRALGAINKGGFARATYLTIAVQLATSSKELVEIATEYHSMKMDFLVPQLLENAETISRTSGDWLLISQAWQAIGNQERSVRAAEKGRSDSSTHEEGVNNVSSQSMPASLPACPICKRPTTLIPQYNRYFCYNCGHYA